MVRRGFLVCLAVRIAARTAPSESASDGGGRVNPVSVRRG